jgi:hypothetical protein
MRPRVDLGVAKWSTPTQDILARKFQRVQHTAWDCADFCKRAAQPRLWC